MDVIAKTQGYIDLIKSNSKIDLASVTTEMANCFAEAGAVVDDEATSFILIQTSALISDFIHTIMSNYPKEMEDVVASTFSFGLTVHLSKIKKLSVEGESAFAKFAEINKDMTKPIEQIMLVMDTLEKNVTPTVVRSDSFLKAVYSDTRVMMSKAAGFKTLAYHRGLVEEVPVIDGLLEEMSNIMKCTLNADAAGILAAAAKSKKILTEMEYFFG